MSISLKLDTKYFTEEEIKEVSDTIDLLIQSGKVEKDAIKEVLSKLKDTTELELDNIYKQLE